MADALASGASVRKDVGVQVPPSAPNKFDSFDTRVSETIELFLLPKILAGQGFSVFPFWG